MRRQTFELTFLIELTFIRGATQRSLRRSLRIITAAIAMETNLFFPKTGSAAIPLRFRKIEHCRNGVDVYPMRTRGYEIFEP